MPALPDGERERIVALHRLGRLGRKLWTALRSYSDVGQTSSWLQDVAKGQGLRRRHRRCPQG
ncbi:MAG: hypothetical protein R3E85_07625 [Planctomycetota bacterium]